LAGFRVQSGIDRDKSPDNTCKRFFRYAQENSSLERHDTTSRCTIEMTILFLLPPSNQFTLIYTPVLNPRK